MDYATNKLTCARRVVICVVPYLDCILKRVIPIENSRSYNRVIGERFRIMVTIGIDLLKRQLFKISCVASRRVYSEVLRES